MSYSEIELSPHDREIHNKFINHDFGQFSSADFLLAADTVANHELKEKLLDKEHWAWKRENWDEDPRDFM